MAVNREICFDTETTGLDPSQGDRLLEIGCVELIDNKRTGKYFHEIINPDRDIPEEAVRIHGISNDKVKDKPFFGDIVHSLIEFFGDSPLIAHNATFDMKFLNSEFDRLGIDRLKNEVIDSLMIAKEKFPGQKNNLDSLCKRFNIDNSKRTFHGALLDAELLADVYSELNGGAQKELINRDTKINVEVSNFQDYLNIIKNNEILKPRYFNLSNDDLVNHNNFIDKNIKNSFWREGDQC